MDLAGGKSVFVMTHAGGLVTELTFGVGSGGHDAILSLEVGLRLRLGLELGLGLV